MKKLAITALAIAGVAVGATAQSIVEINNFASNGYFTQDGTYAASANNAYSGTYGLEVWALGGTTVPSGINLTPAPGYAVNAYQAITAAGFSLVGTFAGQTMSGGSVVGSTQLPGAGIVTIPTTVSPSGSSLTLALVMWNNSQPTAAAMFANANATTKAGVEAFVNTSGNPAPPPAGSPASPLDGLNNDLVMMTVPEPSSFALAGLGAAALLIFRRRK